MNVQESLHQQFPDFDAELLNSINSDGTFKSFEEGIELMRPGQFIRSSMLVLEGLIKVSRQDDEGNEFFMYYLEPGQACAISLICAMGRETSKISAKTVLPTDVMMIPVTKMDEWMSQYKNWNHFVLQTYRNRFNELLETLDSIAFRNMDERLEFYLRRHSKTLQTKWINLTHQQIAVELNSSREVITRLLKKLSDQGKIKLHRNAIELV